MKLHIIPDWHEYRRDLPEINDTIHQTRLFLSQGQEVSLLVLDYLPKLRQILSRKRIESATVWSVFDVLQHIKLTGETPLALNDFLWPDSAQFIDMPDRIMVLVDGKQYAIIWLDRVTLARYEQIDLFEEQRCVQTLIIDDRGFISGVITFDEQGKPVRRDYLTPSGSVAVQEDCQTGRVTTQQSWTNKTVFKNMAELIVTTVAMHMQGVSEEEPLIIAQSQFATFLVNQLNPKQPVILSYQTQRTLPQVTDQLLLQIHGTVDFAVVDTPQQAQELSAQFSKDDEVAVISPYWTTADYNAQVNLPITVIYWYADVVKQSDFDVIRELMMAYPDSLVLIETQQDISALQQQVTEDSQHATNEHGLVTDQSKSAHQSRFQFLSHVTENERLRYLSNVRVLVDLTSQPDQFLQTIALSRAIPQINRVQTPYLVVGKNGELVQNTDDFKRVLTGYMTGDTQQQIVRETARELSAPYQQEMLWVKWQQVFNKIKQRKA